MDNLFLRNLFKFNFSNPQQPPSSTEMEDEDVAGSMTYSTIMNRNYLQFLGDFTAVTNRRREVYKDVELLDEDEIISQALNIFAENATPLDKVSSKTVWVTSENPIYLDSITEMLDRLQIEEKLPKIARQIAKYGDWFMGVVGRMGHGISHLIDGINPADMVRLEKDSQLSAWLNLNRPSSFGSSYHVALQEAYKYVHFRLIGEGDIIDDIRPPAPELTTKYNFDPSAQYGTSMIYRARKIGKKMQLAIDSLMLARMQKAITTRIHFLEVGRNATPQQIIQMTSDYKQTLKTRNKLDTTTDWYKSDTNPWGFGSDIVIPVREGRGRADIQTVGMDVDVNGIVDIDFLQGREFASIGITPDLLTTTGTASTNLLERNIILAKRLMKLQRAIIAGLTTLAQIHLAYKFIEPDTSLFSIHLPAINTISDTERAQALQATIDLGKAIFEFFSGVAGENFNKKYLATYLTKNYFQLPDFDIEELFRSIEGEEGEEEEPEICPGSREIGLLDPKYS